MNKPPSPKRLQRQVDYWNADCPVGQEVSFRTDAGRLRYTKTRSAAQVLGGHTAVIFLEGVTGCYLLDRVAARNVTYPVSA